MGAIAGLLLKPVTDLASGVVNLLTGGGGKPLDFNGMMGGAMGLNGGDLASTAASTLMNGATAGIPGLDQMLKLGTKVL